MSNKQWKECLNDRETAGGWASITANNTTQYPKTTTPKTSQPTFSHAVIGPSTKEIKRGQTVQQTSIWLLNSTNCGMCADCCFYWGFILFFSVNGLNRIMWLWPCITSYGCRMTWYFLDRLSWIIDIFPMMLRRKESRCNATNRGYMIKNFPNVAGSNNPNDPRYAC